MTISLSILRKILFSFFFFFTSYFSFSQTDSCHLRISLLTCSPGDELYSTFGHSALRIIDSIAQQDIVYNYGTFDFDEPGFYTKFIRGKLMYYLSTDDFSSFKSAYQQEKRGMIEQVLNLTCNEKQKMVQLLQQNLMGENRFYKYDFLFDNCTTRLRDLLVNSAESRVQFSKIVKEKTRFRQLIHEYLNYNDKQWSKLGIDLLLGAKTDALMNDKEVMFLPDYLLKGFDSSRIGNKAVVATKQNVYDLEPQKSQHNFFLDPLFIFSLLLIVIVIMHFFGSGSIEKFLYGFDGMLFFITGFAGLLILFMWFGTEHVMCRDNYNILWAWPTHAVIAFYINSKKQSVKRYFTITAIINVIVLLAWFFLPQQMNPAFIPLILLLIFRSVINARRSLYSI